MHKLNQMEDNQLNILHDHYKESFVYIREREKQRDRLFLLMIALFGLLAFQIVYPINFEGSLKEIIIFNTKLNLYNLPVSVFLSTTWTFIIVFILRYCQTTIGIERQYAYLHKLENKISAVLGNDEIYRREGKEYIEKYPIFSSWVWIFYTIIVPLIVLFTTIILIIFELTKLHYSLYNKIYDSLIAITLIISFVFYKIVPLICKILKNK